MPFIVPSVCRFAAVGQFSGREIVNIFDISISEIISPSARADAIADQAAVLIESITDHVTPLQTNDVTWDEVRWVDLHSEDGTVGSTSTGTGAVTWPDAGNVTTGPCPGNVAVLVTKEAQSQRGRRNGRTYWCGVPEADSNDAAPNDLGGGALAAWQSGMDDFLASVNQDGTYDSELAVVHILTRGPDTDEGNPGPPLTGVGRTVDALTVQTRLATQRRRLRG